MGVFEDVVAQTSRKPAGVAGVLDRRRKPRVPALRSSRASLSAHEWTLELLPMGKANAIAGDVDALAKRALEGNVFFEGSVTQASWPRLEGVLAAHRAWLLCLWEELGDGRHLRLFMPVRLARVGFPRRLVLQALANEYMPLGTPLLDRACAGEACEMLLSLLGDRKLNLPSTLDIPFLPADSEIATTLREAAQSQGLPVGTGNEHERAVLLGDRREEFPNHLSKKTRKELARQWRRLEDEGALVPTVAGGKGRKGRDAAIAAFENFLLLELKGWKGRAGTALYNDRKIVAFARQSVAELAERGLCEIHALERDGRVIASLVLMQDSKGGWVTWKIAYDETLAAMSPGVQVMMAASRSLLARKQFAIADSLAIENHPMIDRLWPDRRAMADLTIGLRLDANDELTAVISAKRRLKSLKDFAKAVLKRLKSLRK